MKFSIFIEICILLIISQGIFEMKCGSVERALGYLNRAIELDPVSEIPWVVRSECFTRSESH